jgi:hypothetical protein
MALSMDEHERVALEIYRQMRESGDIRSSRAFPGAVSSTNRMIQASDHCSALFAVDILRGCGHAERSRLFALAWVSGRSLFRQEWPAKPRLRSGASRQPEISSPTEILTGVRRAADPTMEDVLTLVVQGCKSRAQQAILTRENLHRLKRPVLQFSEFLTQVIPSPHPFRLRLTIENASPRGTATGSQSMLELFDRSIGTF